MMMVRLLSESGEMKQQRMGPEDAAPFSLRLESVKLN